MKLGMDFFCSSPASSTTISSGNIQDNNHHTSGLLKDQRRSKTKIHQTPQKGLERGNDSSSSNSLTPRLIRMLSTPCSSSSELALTVKPLNKLEYKQLQKQQQKSSSTRWYGADDGSMVISDKYLRRKSNSTYAGDFIARARAEDRSAKHLLLEERQTFDKGSNSVTSKDSTTALIGRRSSSSRHPHSPLTMVSRSSSPKLKPSSSSPSSANDSSTDKVVVLWVSLHCKGCEAKVRKHISKMEGVNSFSTDLATKRVTIITSMNPREVLASVSRVKYAQFWPATSSS